MSKAVVINTNSIINRLRQLGAASKAKFEEISKSLNVRLNHKGGLEEIPLVHLNSGITPSVVFPVLFDIPVPLNYTRTLPLRHTNHLRICLTERLHPFCRMRTKFRRQRRERLSVRNWV